MRSIKLDYLATNSYKKFAIMSSLKIIITDFRNQFSYSYAI